MIVTAPEDESSDLAYLHEEDQKDDVLEDEEYVDVKDEYADEEIPNIAIAWSEPYRDDRKLHFPS